jgi:hypothetical protein
VSLLNIALKLISIGSPSPGMLQATAPEWGFFAVSRMKAMGGKVGAVVQAWKSEAIS